MTCHEIKKKLFLAQDPQTMPEVQAHIEICADCHRLLAVERLSGLLVKARAKQVDAQEQPAFSPFLMARIRNRIREMSDQGVGSWEAAILALRGWLLAFGTVAIILLLLSVGAQTRTLTRDHETVLSSISNVNEVLLSGNMNRQAETDNGVTDNGTDE